LVGISPPFGEVKSVGPPHGSPAPLTGPLRGVPVRGSLPSRVRSAPHGVEGSFEQLEVCDLFHPSARPIYRGRGSNSLILSTAPLLFRRRGAVLEVCDLCRNCLPPPCGGGGGQLRALPSRVGSDLAPVPPGAGEAKSVGPPHGSPAPLTGPRRGVPVRGSLTPPSGKDAGAARPSRVRSLPRPWRTRVRSAPHGSLRDRTP